MRGDAAKNRRRIRIDRQRALEQFLRRLKVAPVGVQVAEQAQCRDIVGVRGERAAAAVLGLARVALQAQCGCQAHLRRRIVRPQRQGGAETGQRLRHLSVGVLRGGEVVVTLRALRTQFDRSAQVRERFVVLAPLAQRVAEVVERLDEARIQRQCLAEARHGFCFSSEGRQGKPQVVMRKTQPRREGDRPPGAAQLLRPALPCCRRALLRLQCVSASSALSASAAR